MTTPARDRIRRLLGDVSVDILAKLVREDFRETLTAEEESKVREGVAHVVDTLNDQTIVEMSAYTDDELREGMRAPLEPLVRAAVAPERPS